MGKLFITEEEKNRIKLLYENEDKYKLQNEYLQKFVGKTVNLYKDKLMRDLDKTLKINEINYSGRYVVINVNDDFNRYYINCLYNPSQISQEITNRYGGPYYSKQFIDTINNSGIKWCEKPKADFGLNNTTNNNLV